MAEDTQVISLRAPRELLRRAEELANAKKWSRNLWLVEAIEAQVEREDRLRAEDAEAAKRRPPVPSFDPDAEATDG